MMANVVAESSNKNLLPNRTVTYCCSVDGARSLVFGGDQRVHNAGVCERARIAQIRCVSGSYFAQDAPHDFAGSRLEIAFNPFFLLDILRHSKDETVRIGLNDAHNPGLITDSTHAQFVLMPMRLSEISAGAPEAALATT